MKKAQWLTQDIRRKLPARILKNNEKVRCAIIAHMEERGITPSLLSEVIHDGITAREDHLDPMSKPERITRLKYLEKIMSLYGLDNKATENQPQSWEGLIQQININVEKVNDD